MAVGSDSELMLEENANDSERGRSDANFGD
jgi:hypothetical protein